MSVSSLLPEVSEPVRFRSSRGYKEKSSGLIPYINTSKSAILLGSTRSVLLIHYCSATVRTERASHTPLSYGYHLHNRNCASPPVLLVSLAFRTPTELKKPGAHAPSASFDYQLRELECPN